MVIQPYSAYISGAEYLTSEERGDLRHEYIGGRIYAITGASYRRDNDCQAAVVTDPQTVLALPCAGLDLSLASAYEDVPLGADS